MSLILCSIRQFEAHHVCCRLVIETLEPLPKERKCFRLINGVLVERTIEDVIPSLKTNADGLKKVLEELMKQYKAKQEEMDKWKVGSSIQCSGRHSLTCRVLQKENNIQVVQQ